VEALESLRRIHYSGEHITLPTSFPDTRTLRERVQTESNAE